MVRRSVFSHQSGTVDAERDWQLLQRYVVDDVVVAALQESGIDAAERFDAVFGQSAGEGHGMAFGDADVKRTFRECFLHIGHGAARCHGCCDAYDFRILFGQFNQRFAENVLVFHAAVALFSDNLARFLVEFSGSMPECWIFFGRFVAFTFCRAEVKDARTVHVLDVVEHANEAFDVVSVIRSEITDVQPFKYVLLS